MLLIEIVNTPEEYTSFIWRNSLEIQIVNVKLHALQYEPNMMEPQMKNSH